MDDEIKLTREEDISKRIEALERELTGLYADRRGMMQKQVSPSYDNEGNPIEFGWCVNCGKNLVCPNDGNDTCGDCLRNI